MVRVLHPEAELPSVKQLEGPTTGLGGEALPVPGPRSWRRSQPQSLVIT